MSTQPPPSNVEIHAPVTNSVVVGVNAGTITNIVQVAQLVTSLHQLRAPLADFVGRAREYAQLCDALRYDPDQSKLAAICGMGGMGKTELALRVAHRLRMEYPDAQLFLNLRAANSDARRSLDDALRDALHAFDADTPPTDDLAALAAAYRGHLSGKRCLVVLDDAADDADLQPFLPPAGCALLITSRSRLMLDGQGLALTLDTLDRQEARALLLDDVPRLQNDANLDELLNQLADLPLAVRVVGAAFRANPLLTCERYVERLQDAGRRAAALRFNRTDVLAVLGAAYETLAAQAPDTARHWCMLCVCPAPFDEAAAASIWDDADYDRVIDTLGALAQHSLLTFDDATRRFRLHDLLADIAKARCPDDDLERASLRHATHYFALAQEAQRMYESGGTSVLPAIRLFDASWQHLQSAAAWLARSGAPEATQTLVRLARVPFDLVLQRTRPRHQRFWFEATLRAAQAQNDALAEGRALIGLGDAYAAQGDGQRATTLIRQGFSKAREAGDTLGSALAANDLAIVHMEQSQFEQAQPLLEYALKQYKALGDRRREAQTMVNLGTVYDARGQSTQAMRIYGRSLALLRATGDVRTQVFVLGNLGIAHRDQGQLDKAHAVFSGALRLARALGDTSTSLQLGWHLGVIEARRGNRAQARSLMEPFVAYLRNIGDDDTASFEQQMAQLTGP